VTSPRCVWFTRMTSAALCRPFVLFVFAALVTAPMVSPTLGRTVDSALAAPVAFNIPAQPLSRALIAYSAATGLEIFYKAALAEGQWSTGVVGSLSPAEALQELLKGTGYSAKSTGAGAFTILPAASETAIEADTRRREYEPYFAIIQARIADALCRNASATVVASEVVVRTWFTPLGFMVRAEVLQDDGGPATDQSLAAAIRGVSIGQSLPAGMPQPINMVIFPASKVSGECPPSNRPRRSSR